MGRGRAAPQIIDGDWNRLRQVIGRLSAIILGSEATPTFAGLTLTGLSSDRLIGSNSGVLQSEDLTSWIAGTSNQVAIADDGDGSVTLSTPQDIHTGASPTFTGLTLSGLTANRLTKTDGSSVLTASGISIDASNNLSGIGTLAAGVTTITSTAGNQLIIAYDGTDRFIINAVVGGNVGLRAPAGDLVFTPETAGDVFINTTGILGAGVDGGCDLGASNANRFDNAFVRTNIAAGGQFIVADGTVADPSIYFPDLDGGIYAGNGLDFALSEVHIMGITTTAVTLANNINFTLGGTGTVTSGSGGFDGTSGNIRTTGDLNIGMGGTVLDVDSTLGVVGIGSAAVVSAQLTISPIASKSDSFTSFISTPTITPTVAGKDYAGLSLSFKLAGNDTDVVNVGTLTGISSILLLDNGIGTTRYLGTIDLVRGIFTTGTMLGAGPDKKFITDYRHFSATGPQAGVNVNISTLYGLYLGAMTEGEVANWVIYSLGGDSYHAGDMAFGQTDKAERIGSDADGTLDLYAGTSIVLHTDTKLDNAKFHIFDKASGNGIKIDTSTPTFGFADLLGDVTVKNTGGTRPALITYRNGLLDFEFAAGEEEYFKYHIPHDYVKGTDIFLHFHWSHTGTLVTGGTLTFDYEISYAKGHAQAAFPASVSGTVISATANTTQYTHELTEVQISASSPSGSQIDTDDLEPDGVIVCTAGLNANNLTVSGGAVPDPFIHYVDIHYQTTGLIGTKAKAPDFYA